MATGAVAWPRTPGGSVTRRPVTMDHIRSGLPVVRAEKKNYTGTRSRGSSTRYETRLCIKATIATRPRTRRAMKSRPFGRFGDDEQRNK